MFNVLWLLKNKSCTLSFISDMYLVVYFWVLDKALDGIIPFKPLVVIKLVDCKCVEYN